MPVEARHSTRGSMTCRRESAPRAEGAGDGGPEDGAAAHPPARQRGLGVAPEEVGRAVPRHPRLELDDAPERERRAQLGAGPGPGGRETLPRRPRRRPAAAPGPSQPRSPGPRPFTLWSVIPEMGAKRASPAWAETASGPATLDRQEGRREGREPVEGRHAAAQEAEGHERDHRLPGRAGLAERADLLVVDEVPLEQQVGKGVSAPPARTGSRTASRWRRSPTKSCGPGRRRRPGRPRRSRSSPGDGRASLRSAIPVRSPLVRLPPVRQRVVLEQELRLPLHSGERGPPELDGAAHAPHARVLPLRRSGRRRSTATGRRHNRQ